MPLPSGPDGGDVIIAKEVLEHTCHSVVFFHDPMTAHPHNDDIRLLERTCQVPGVFAECVADSQSAELWIEGIKNETELNSVGQRPGIAQQLRQRWNLSEVIIVASESDEDSDELGQAIARACAGYLNQRLTAFAATGTAAGARIGIAWGWGARQILAELETMEIAGLIEKAPRLASLVWSPLIGVVTSEVSTLEPSVIAQGFADFFGGTVQGFACAGFSREGSVIPPAEQNLIKQLEDAEMIITSASSWDSESALYKYTGLDNSFFPDPSATLSRDLWELRWRSPA